MRIPARIIVWALLPAAVAAGCARTQHTPANPTATAGASDLAVIVGASGDKIRDALIASERKAVMGRYESLGDVRRVLRDDDPLVQAATKLADVQSTLAEIARDEGVPVDEARRRWVLLQDADILIESGGDPEAVSSAGAVGVSQWMPGAAGHGTFPVDTARSAALTAQIDDLEWRLVWLDYWLTPGHDAIVAGLPRVAPSEAAAQGAMIERRLSDLRAQRIRIDGRYDPAQAIDAQARYLIGLYDRFPSVDWLFQAYHGGEAGVDRLVKKYLGPSWPGSTVDAIRSGNDGKPLTFERVFENVAPRSHADAFLYLYGRGDDHRHYWWKILAGVDALQLYRRDPAGFQRAWASLAPGRSIAALWYPRAATQAIGSTASMRRALASGRLGVVTTGPGVTFGAPSNPTVGVPVAPSPPIHTALVPQAKEALKQIASLYTGDGGTGAVKVTRMTLTTAEAAVVKREEATEAVAHPTPPSTQTLPDSGPPPEFDYHTIGVAFDLDPPDDRTNRKILTYVLDMLKIRGAIQWYVDRTDSQPDRWIVIAAPVHLGRT